MKIKITAILIIICGLLAPLGAEEGGDESGWLLTAGFKSSMNAGDYDANINYRPYGGFGYEWSFLNLYAGFAPVFNSLINGLQDEEALINIYNVSGLVSLYPLDEFDFNFQYSLGLSDSEYISNEYYFYLWYDFGAVSISGDFSYGTASYDPGLGQLDEDNYNYSAAVDFNLSDSFSIDLTYNGSMYTVNPGAFEGSRNGARAGTFFAWDSVFYLMDGAGFAVDSDGYKIIEADIGLKGFVTDNLSLGCNYFFAYNIAEKKSDSYDSHFVSAGIEFSL